jgi:hypothetical protein
VVILLSWKTIVTEEWLWATQIFNLQRLDGFPQPYNFVEILKQENLFSPLRSCLAVACE